MHRPSLTLVLAVSALFGTSAAAQAPLPWHRLTIPGEGELGFDPSAPVWLDDRRLVLVDQGEHQLVVLDISHGTSTRLGRSGQGPGEFAGSLIPVRMAGGIAVWDVPLRRLTRFDRDLALTGTTSFTVGLTAIAAINDSKVVGVGGLGGRPFVYGLDFVASKAESLFAIGSTDSALLARPMPGFPGPPPVVGLVGVRGRVILYSQWSYALVAADSSGKILAAGGRRELPAQTPSAATVAARRTRMEQSMTQMDSATRKQMGPIFERSLAMPDPFVVTGGMGTDESGCLYAVTTRRRADSTEVDVLSADGHYVRTVAVPGKVTAVSRDGAAMAFITEEVGGDSDGTSSLLIYRPTHPGALCR